MVLFVDYGRATFRFNFFYFPVNDSKWNVKRLTIDRGAGYVCLLLLLHWLLLLLCLLGLIVEFGVIGVINERPG